MKISKNNGKIQQNEAAKVTKSADDSN